MRDANTFKTGDAAIYVSTNTSVRVPVEVARSQPGVWDLRVTSDKWKRHGYKKGHCFTVWNTAHLLPQKKGSAGHANG